MLAIFEVHTVPQNDRPLYSKVGYHWLKVALTSLKIAQNPLKVVRVSLRVSHNLGQSSLQ